MTSEPEAPLAAFDFIGDVHGCYRELVLLLDRLGYEVGGSAGSRPEVVASAGRKAFFLGDLVNRGPDTPGVLRLVIGMVEAGDAFCVAGNHDVMLQHRLINEDVEDPRALVGSMRQLKSEPPGFKDEVVEFISHLPASRMLEGGRLAAAHAGLPAEYQDAPSEEARRVAIFGRNVVDANGKTVRYVWARDYRGEAIVIYAHTPQVRPEWLNRTLCIDTGCVYGGRLTALRYPEMELVSVKAARVYHKSGRTAALRAAAKAEPETRQLGWPTR